MLIGSAWPARTILIVGSIRVGGLVTYDGALIIVRWCWPSGRRALLWFLVSLHGLRPAVGAAAGIGLAICAAHYVGEYAIGVHSGPDTGCRCHRLASALRSP